MSLPDDPLARAEALSRAGRREEALRVLQEAVAADPGSAAGHRALGGLLTGLGRRDEALASYERALALEPDHPATLVNHGNLLTDLKRWTEALESFDRAIAGVPNLPQPYGNKARILNLLDRPLEALEAADRAIELAPTYAKGWSRRGDAFLAMERHPEALESYRRAVELSPDEYVLVGMANALKGLMRYEEALENLDRAEAMNRQEPLAPYHRSLVRLLLGQYEGGWRDYEARWRLASFYDTSSSFVTAALRKQLTLYPTRELLADQKVLVASEQGIGDQLMHASMLPDLLADARSVTWICDRRLHRLLAPNYPAVRFVDPRDTPYLENDFSRLVASGSLAHAYRRTVADFPGTPFVQPRGEVVQAWSERLGSRREKLRIGLSWRGGTQRTGRSRRSMSLADLAPLLTRSDCEFVSLQYGDAQVDVDEARTQTGVDVRLFPSAEIDDFEDLAGLVANLDLVVSVQTALVHLCGAMGRPALVMVPQRPEWRYQAQGSSMPWYRSVRLIRQREQWDWDAVIAEVVEAVDVAAKQA